MAPLTRGLQLLASAIRYALASAGLVTPPLLSRPTPCAEWDVAVLLDHVSDSASVLRQAITAGCVSPGPPPGGGSPGLGPVHGLHRQATRLLAVCTAAGPAQQRSEEHTSELQSRPHLVCRLLLEKKKKKNKQHIYTKKKKKSKKPLQ